MTQASALAASATRLAEIQDLVDRHPIPDHSWAEQLFRDESGVWTQAYRLQNGRAEAITEVVWVPLTTET